MAKVSKMVRENLACCVKSMGCKIVYGQQTYHVISVMFLPPMVIVINGKYIITDFF
jgi:hypothetical protein